MVPRLGGGGGAHGVTDAAAPNLNFTWPFALTEAYTTIAGTFVVAGSPRPRQAGARRAWRHHHLQRRRHHHEGPSHPPRAPRGMFLGCPSRWDYFDFIPHISLCFPRASNDLTTDDPLTPPPTAAAPGHRAPRRQEPGGHRAIAGLRGARPPAPDRALPPARAFHFQANLVLTPQPRHSKLFLYNVGIRQTTRTHLSIAYLHRRLATEPPLW